MKNWKTKLTLTVIAVLSLFLVILWTKNEKIKKQKFLMQLEARKTKLSSDSLLIISEGHYQKLVADSLEIGELKSIIDSVIDLNGRTPKTITKTVIKPIEIIKYVDSTRIKNDSIFITDYYPDKETSFLKYTNRTSLATQKGKSKFNFSPITLNHIVSKKNNGFYTVDFVGPEFIEVESLDMQAEYLPAEEKDNWGTLIGVEYGQNLENQTNIFEINAYQRYKKFYFGGAVSTNKDLKAGIKIEF